jgi:hypothetical protein
MPRPRKQLRAKTPLERHTPLRQVSGLKASAMKQKRGHRLPVDVSAVVAERSGGRCEVRWAGCSTYATQKHHRITQKAGGRHGAAQRRSDRPSNLLHVCGWCHHVITYEPAWAKAFERGFALNERDEPTQLPVRYRGRLSYLDDAGGVHDYEEVGA